jgi:hypothetical protein
MMATVSRETVRRARRDVQVFAEALVGERLWPHQEAVARSEARIRSVCSGRQAGKSRTVAVCGLHTAFVAPNRRVLVLSAGEQAARDLLAECARLASSPLLAGSVIDESNSEIVLSNGSWIRSVPASERQIRGLSVDLLVIDEAAFVADELWTAARFTTISRRESRVLLASTPFGRADRFFATAWRAGQRGEASYESFHWPSTISPLVDKELLEVWRASSTDREYRREVEAEWVEDHGAYFTDAELEGATGDYDLVPPEGANGLAAGVGVDWGFDPDSSAVVLVARDPDEIVDGHAVAWLPWLEELSRVPYHEVIDRICEIGAPGVYTLGEIVSEQNGVGAAPTQMLEARRVARVRGVHTTAASKEDGFGRIKVLLQQGRLELPRHPGLLRQLGALAYETTDTGTVRIAVPQHRGHDDLAMAFMLAVGADRELSGRPRRRSRFRGAISSSNVTERPAPKPDPRPAITGGAGPPGPLPTAAELQEIIRKETR